ncbi:MAG: FAD:protein FMN transferase [Jatrophihabitans sp.]
MSGDAASIELATVRPVRRVEQCMGTVFSIEVRLPGCAAAAIDDAVSWLHWVDRTFSPYQQDSQLSRLARDELAVEDCVPEVGQILARCAELETETRGYFSATAGGVLDPSGLVKGWAIQHASEMLSAAGSTSHCVNGGGDVQCAGPAAAGRPWRIGIADPLQAGRLAGIVAGRDLAVATSGTAERGNHILDPHTGHPRAELASVSLVGRQLASVDAYATAAFAMGVAAPEWIEALPDCQGLIVYPDGRRWSSTGLTLG